MTSLLSIIQLLKMEATQNSNIASVAWSDHVIFGESDGRLDTVPALRRRMNSWKADLGAQIIHWRCTRDGKDIWVEDFDLSRWQDLKGAALTLFLTEMRESLNKSDHMLAVGAPRGRILGPPLGNTSLQWEIWVEEGIVDHLIIDQNSSRCPSMWHDLWPMHRGYGYLQNYLNGFNMNSLEEDLASVYQPIFNRQHPKLYLARQWHHRAPIEERSLQEHPCVEGLVFSTFRHDNAVPIQRNDWTA
jgi:hypothetical protein